MKKLLKYFSATLLSMLIVFGSSGIAVSTMLCLKSGKTTISIGNEDECCKGEEADCEEVESNCCDINKTNFSIDDYTASSFKKETKQENDNPISENPAATQSPFFRFPLPIINLHPPDSFVKPFGKTLLYLISRITI
jgi:hypothetical protein